MAKKYNDKNYYLLLILSVLLGTIGADRFYVGKYGTGILKLLTGGGLYVWYIIDILLIVCNKLEDKDGLVPKR